MVPGIPPAAKQQGRYVGREPPRAPSPPSAERTVPVRRRRPPRQIGKRSAVVDFGGIALRGTPAWWFWGAAHIYFLVVVRSCLAVVLNWLWLHWRNQRAARLVTQGREVDGG